jgi:hypothetical protein
MACQECEVHCPPGTEFEEIEASAFVSPLISPRANRRFLLARNRPLLTPWVVADCQQQGLRRQRAPVFSLRSE